MSYNFNAHRATIRSGFADLAEIYAQATISAKDEKMIEKIVREISQSFIIQQMELQQLQNTPGQKVRFEFSALKKLLLPREQAQLSAAIWKRVEEELKAQVHAFQSVRKSISKKPGVIGLRQEAEDPTIAEKREKAKRQREAKLEERKKKRAATKLLGLEPAKKLTHEEKRALLIARPAVDLYMYNLQLKKSQSIRDFSERFFAKWAIEHPNCTSSSKAALPCLANKKTNRDFQNEVGRRIQTQREIALFWPMGWGKTHGAILAAECALEESKRLKNKNRKVTVITKKSLVANFAEGLCGYGRDEEWIANNYRIYGKEEALKGAKVEEVAKDVKNGILILDESHDFMRATIREGDTKITEGVYAAGILKLAATAWKVIIMTGTPIVNYVSDLYNTALMFSGDKKKFQEVFPSADSMNKFPDYSKEQVAALNEAFECKVSYISPDAPREGFPSSTEFNVLIEMDPKYYKAYESLEVNQIDADAKKINQSNYRDLIFKTKYGDNKAESDAGFYFEFRKAVNNLPGVPPLKLNFIIDLALKNKRAGKTMTIYSSFLEHGLQTLEKALEKNGIRYGIISGKVKVGSGGKRKAFKCPPEGKDKKEKVNADDDEKTDRQSVKNRFNRRELDVLLLSAAGATGIDLWGASSHVNLEGGWNEATKAQANARVIRYKSHEKEKLGNPKLKIPAHVDVYNLMLAKPHDMKVYEEKMQRDIKEKKAGAPDDVLIVHADKKLKSGLKVSLSKGRKSSPVASKSKSKSKSKKSSKRLPMLSPNFTTRSSVSKTKKTNKNRRA